MKLNWIFLVAVFLTPLMGIQSCATVKTSSITVNGKVIDDSTSMPINGAIVVATWTGHITTFMSGHYTCYHVDSTQTNPDGSFVIKTKISYPTELDDPPNSAPSIVVYKPGYESSIGRAREAGLWWATSHTEQVERFGWKNGVKYLVPATHKGTDRLRYLNLVARADACYGSNTDRKNLMLVNALIAEARSIAVTDYDEYLIRKLEHRRETLEGNDEAPYPQRSTNSVILAVERNDAKQLRAILSNPGSDPNERDDRDETALNLAIFRGQVDIVKLLLEAGADPNKVSFEPGYTALQQAINGAITFGTGRREAYANHLMVIEALLASEKLCDRRITAFDDNESKDTSLRNYPEIIKLIQGARLRILQKSLQGQDYPCS